MIQWNLTVGGKAMNLYKTIKGAVKKVILIVSILLITGWIWMAWELVLKHYIPIQKTHFRDYDAFYRKIGDNRFPREFPDTAEDPKYYFYTGQFDKMYGVSFIVGEEEFQELKLSYFSEYTELAIEYETSESINYLFHEKLTDPFIQDEKIAFVRELMREEADRYSILAFEKAENFDFVYRFGVFLNDLTGEFIILYFQDAFPQKPGQQTEEPSAVSIE